MSNELSRALQLLSSKKDTTFFYGFLPKIITNYFDDNVGQDTDQKIKTSNAGSYVLTGSIDTTAIDAYRQGVELTRQKHFDAGSFAKIHAGEPGHVLRKNFYGADRNFLKQDYYQDLEYYTSIKYLTADQVTLTYPIVTHDTDETENYNFNGVIEPLTIRAIAAFFSIDIPFEAHSIKGMVMDGNADMTSSSSKITTVDDKVQKYRIAPWLDLIDMMGTVKKIPTMAFFNDDKTLLSPFNDASSKVLLSTSMPQNMINALLDMSPSTEEYIPEGKFSAPCGWTYDDVMLKGTDSITFGGLGY